MKQQPTKSEIRNEMAQQVRKFLSNGGQINQVAQGSSGLKDGKYCNNGLGFEKPRQERTPVPEVVAAIEAQRRPKTSPAKNTSTSPKRPRKKLIYDDFGDPLRWVWVRE